MARGQNIGIRAGVLDDHLAKLVRSAMGLNDHTAQVTTLLRHQLRLVDPLRDVVDSLLRQEREIQRLFRESDEALRRSESDVRLLAHCGWTLPMWGAPNFHVLVMDQVGRENPDVAEIDAAFLEHYTEKGGVAFDEILADILASDGLAPWRALLIECVSSYRRAEFNLPIPALFAVLEGAAIVVSDAPTKKEPVRPMLAASKASKHTMELLIRVSVCEFLRELFTSVDFTQAEPVRPNRHWVLHGRSRRAFGRLDCIRLFHALHTLSHEATRETRA